MQGQTIAFALAAGLVAALNPCGFAMLPGYLTLVIAGEGQAQRSRIAAVGRALAATAVMASGFVALFAAFGLVLAPLAAEVQRYLPVLTVVIGAGLIAVGGWMLAGRQLSVRLPRPQRGAPTARLWSLFGYGVAYAITSLSCTLGPFLAVTGVTFRSGSIIGGIAAYVAYAVGMALLVGVVATATALAAAPLTTRLRRWLPYLGRAGGVLLGLTGAYVVYYGVYELRLNFGSGNADDPIIGAAVRIPQVVSAQVATAGALPIVIVLAVLVGITAALGWRRTIRRRNAAGERLERSRIPTA
jgi:cytochrome c-type biogenesis protein